MGHKEDDYHKKKGEKIPIGFCGKCLQSKMNCRCCMVCAPQPCRCQQQNEEQSQHEEQHQDQEQYQEATQVPIQTGSELEANQEQDQEQSAIQEGSDQEQEQNTVQLSKQEGGDTDQEQNAIQEGSDQDQEQEQNTVQISKQEGADTDQEQNTTQNPIIIGPSPDQETSQNTDTTSTLNTMVTPTIMSDPNTTATLDTMVTPTIMSDPDATTTLDTTVTPTVTADTETTASNVTMPITDTESTTTITPTITNTTETTPMTSQTVSTTPTQTTTQTQEGQIQEQSETQTQTLGDQLQAQGQQTIQGHTNDSPLNNSQTISTTVSGVTVNLNVECGCNEKKNRKKNRKDCEREECEGCDCCNSSIATLLQMIQTTQAGILLPIDKQITIYTNIPLPTGNPIPNQVLTNVNDCIFVTFKDASQVTATPNTTLQMSTIAGISAVNDITTTNDIFDFLLGIANNCSIFQKENKCCDCDSNRNCEQNSCCFNTLRSELETFATVGLKINLFISGLAASIDNLFVLKICDCLAFFVDNLTTPTTIYVFSLCSIVGYTVPTQTLP